MSTKPRPAVRAKASAKPRAAKPRAAARPKAAKPAVTPRVSTHPPKERTPAIEAVIARVSELCLALPDVTEVMAWGEPTWRARGKLFAMFDTHHHGNPHLSVWLAAPPGAQAALIDADPERFWRPPYLGHRGWVGMRLDGRPDWAEVAALVRRSYRMTAPKRLALGVEE